MDLHSRHEERFIVKDADCVVSQLEKLMKRLVYSETEVVQTIYFNNDEHTVPFSKAIKARRYARVPGEIDPKSDELWMVDTKTGTGGFNERTRRRMTLAQAVAFANSDRPADEPPYRPYTLAEYARRHFANEGGQLRVTVDKDTRYFDFSADGSYAFLEQESGTRIEMKAGERSDCAAEVRNIIKRADARPAVSKKLTSYFLLGRHIIKTDGNKLFKELPGYEIEAKIEAPDEGILWQIKKDVRAGKLPGFELPSHFPFTLEHASFNRYYRDGEGGVIKAMFGPTRIGLVRKGEYEDVDDPYGCGCITKRAEQKGEFAEPGDLRGLEFLGELYRCRKAFWIDSAVGRTYHLSIDECYNQSDKILQLEVEYVGRYSQEPGAKEEEITRDVSRIAAWMLREYPNLHPSKLTKQEWLGI